MSALCSLRLQVLFPPAAGARKPAAVLHHYIEEPPLAFEGDPLGRPLPVLREDRFVDDDRSVGEAAGAIAGDGRLVCVVVMDATPLRERLVIGANDQRF